MRWDWDILLVLVAPAIACALVILMGAIAAVTEWRHRHH